MTKSQPRLMPASEQALLAEPKKHPYLKYVKMERFGAFTQKVAGPFSPGLNVVFGRNEAGKTTVASFVKGVLFGWEEARGTRNTYRPENAERAGALIFASREDGENEQVLSRVRNVDGPQGDSSLLGDIDKETYSTIFSLDSDELLSLRSTTNVTAKLLTAGAGTESSPAEALVEIERRLAEYTSRAAHLPHSLVQLATKIQEGRRRIAEATAETERVHHLDREFAELEPEREQMLARIDDVNDEIEQLTASRAVVERIDQQLEDLRQQRDGLREDMRGLAAERRAHFEAFDTPLATLSASEERALRDQIDALADKQAKHDHSVDLAAENHAASSAAYEALQEASDQPDLAHERRQRHVQVALSIVLPVVFLIVGAGTFLHGRQISSLSFTALGVGLVVFSLFLASAALVMLMRPNKQEELAAARQRDAQWVMLQDKKKLEAVEAARDENAQAVRAQLDEAGLAAAQGSLRRARSLLDEAREAREIRGMLDQRRRALTSRLGSVEEAIADATQRRSAAFEAAGLGQAEQIQAFDEALSRAVRKRAALLEASESMNRRYGELKQILAQARETHRLDELKLEQQQLLTRQEEGAREYASLLLAKRMLQAAIDTWESKSQPEVYRQASRYLRLMTDGRWEKIAMSPEGLLQVTDAAKTVRDPGHLSLGTRQQLYLALRIALLQQADNVGRSVPVFADDILVNFDTPRRLGAARALAELARTRQVVLFTCHEEVVDALREADPGVTQLQL